MILETISIVDSFFIIIVNGNRHDERNSEDDMKMLLTRRSSLHKTRSSTRGKKLFDGQIDVPSRNLPNSQENNWSPARNMISDLGWNQNTKNPVVIKGKRKSSKMTDM